MNNLGNGLRARYAARGSFADLEEAIAVYRQAVQATPAGSPDLPSRLNNLGNGLRARYAAAARRRAIAVIARRCRPRPPAPRTCHLNNRRRPRQLSPTWKKPSPSIARRP
ncbi:MAG: tetratricopeptide repeat protein [Ardenticatenales bacterium]|nr:tetratricopeptide repeat protein [Ardenticatenales bacterium]